jgi:hypothetical protein
MNIEIYENIAAIFRDHEVMDAIPVKGRSKAEKTAKAMAWAEANLTPAYIAPFTLRWENEQGRGVYSHTGGDLPICTSVVLADFLTKLRDAITSRLKLENTWDKGHVYINHFPCPTRFEFESLGSLYVVENGTYRRTSTLPGPLSMPMTSHILLSRNYSGGFTTETGFRSYRDDGMGLYFLWLRHAFPHIFNDGIFIESSNENSLFANSATPMWNSIYSIRGLNDARRKEFHHLATTHSMFFVADWLTLGDAEFYLKHAKKRIRTLFLTSVNP